MGALLERKRKHWSSKGCFEAIPAYNNVDIIVCDTAPNSRLSLGPVQCTPDTTGVNSPCKARPCCGNMSEIRQRAKRCSDPPKEYKSHLDGIGGCRSCWYEQIQSTRVIFRFPAQIFMVLVCSFLPSMPDVGILRSSIQITTCWLENCTFTS